MPGIHPTPEELAEFVNGVRRGLPEGVSLEEAAAKVWASVLNSMPPPSERARWEATEAFNLDLAIVDARRYLRRLEHEIDRRETEVEAELVACKASKKKEGRKARLEVLQQYRESVLAPALERAQQARAGLDYTAGILKGPPEVLHPPGGGPSFTARQFLCTLGTAPMYRNMVADLQEHAAILAAKGPREALDARQGKRQRGGGDHGRESMQAESRPDEEPLLALKLYRQEKKPHVSMKVAEERATVRFNAWRWERDKRPITRSTFHDKKKKGSAIERERKQSLME